MGWVMLPVQLGQFLSHAWKTGLVQGYGYVSLKITLFRMQGLGGDELRSLILILILIGVNLFDACPMFHAAWNTSVKWCVWCLSITGFPIAFSLISMWCCWSSDCGKRLVTSSVEPAFEGQKDAAIPGHLFLSLLSGSIFFTLWWTNMAGWKMDTQKKRWFVRLFWGLNVITRWWFQIFFIFAPKIGEDSQFDEHIFQRGWFNHQPDYFCRSCLFLAQLYIW